MPIESITQKEFYAHDVYKLEMANMLGQEVKWYKESANNLLAIIIHDTIDSDWAYVVLAKDSDGLYRAIEVEASIETIEDAEKVLMSKLKDLMQTGEFKEELYEDVDSSLAIKNIVITDINEEVKRYFKTNPEKLHELSPRKFEELVASILEDMGLTVELTKATRDGGSDIIAQIKNSLTSLLILVECKKYAPDNKVDVSIVRSVAGVHMLREPAKSIIVTTSSFTKDARLEASQFKGKIDLKDYNDLKEWLSKY